MNCTKFRSQNSRKDLKATLWETKQKGLIVYSNQIMSFELPIPRFQLDIGNKLRVKK